MKKALKSMASTLGVLLGLWGVLGLVAFFNGVLPPLDGSMADATPTEESVDAADDVVSEADTVDGAVQTPDAGVEDAEAEADVGTTEETASDVLADASQPASSLLRRWQLPVAAAEYTTLSEVALFGGGRPAWVIGTAEGWDVIASSPQGPMRVATFRRAMHPNGLRPRWGQAVATDVDGDTHADLLLPLAYESETGVRGGALFGVNRSAAGGFGEARVIAPVAAYVVNAVSSGTESRFAVLNHTRPQAQLPTEIWMFAGGASPVRRQVVRSLVGATQMFMSDFDRDGHVDLVSMSPTTVRFHFGDAEGEFTRSHNIAMRGLRELGVADLDGDGARDVVLLGEGMYWVHAGAIDAMDPHGLDGIPTAFRGMQWLDVNADGRCDVVGWSHPRLMQLLQDESLRFHSEPMFELGAGSFGPLAHRLTDWDADGAVDDLLLLGTTAGEGAPLELVIVENAAERERAGTMAEAQSLPDAPLLLRVALPGA